MSKLTETLSDLNNARESVKTVRADLNHALGELDGAKLRVKELEKNVAELRQRLGRAKTRFVDVTAKLHPLLDADVAGICGSNRDEQPADPEEAHAAE